MFEPKSVQIQMPRARQEIGFDAHPENRDHSGAGLLTERAAILRESLGKPRQMAPVLIFVNISLYSITAKCLDPCAAFLRGRGLGHLAPGRYGSGPEQTPHF